MNIEPKCDEFWANNVCYYVPRPPLEYRCHNWLSKLRLRHAMKVLKRLLGFVPSIENAYEVELIECEEECWLRIRMGE